MTSTILFADIEGSVELFRRLGDAGALAVVERCHALVQAAITRHDGTVVKFIGDGLMAIFTGADAACDAAVGAQQAMATLAPLAPLRLRIGFHTGSVIEAEGDYFGDVVNIAARLCAAGSGGEIIVSAEAADLLPRHQKAMLRRLGLIAVKGLQDRVSISEILWSQEADVTQVRADLGVQTTFLNRPRLDIRSPGGGWRAVAGETKVMIGRDATNAIIVLDPRASREHATIAYRGHQWLLIDHSTNGTTIAFPGEAEIKIRRQDLVLHGIGRLGFGFSPDEASAEALHFRVFSPA